MTFIRQLSFVFAAVFSLSAIGHQDDVRVLLRKPTHLFSGNEEGETRFLTAFAARASFGGFVYSDEFHTWQFGLGFDEAMIAFGENALWRMGLNIDAIADTQSKDFFFRLGQTHYEVFTALELRLDESIFYIGHRHRCRHAADATDARIVMKTGPEIGFNGLFHLGPVELTTATSALVYLAGQNDDLSHQHRVNLSGALQAEVKPNEKVGIFASAGLSAIWVTASEEREYTVFTKALNSEVHFSPGAAAGVNLKGDRGLLKLYFAYNSNLDAGFREKAQQTHIGSVNFDFWY